MDAMACHCGSIALIWESRPIFSVKFVLHVQKIFLHLNPDGYFENLLAKN